MKTNDKTGGSAFPHLTYEFTRAGGEEGASVTDQSNPGATWIDVCAWHALQGLLSDTAFSNTHTSHHAAVVAFDYAAAMLDEKRRREQEGGAMSTEHAKPEGHGLKMPLSYCGCACEDSEGSQVFVIPNDSGRSANQESAVRDFVLRACNAHEGLVGALKTAVMDDHHWHGNGCAASDGRSDCNCWVSEARAALAVAEGKEAAK